MNIDDHIYAQLVGNIYWKDRFNRYLGCNNAFAKLCGLRSPDDIVGKTDADFMKNKEHLALIQKIDQLVIETGEEKTIEEIGLDEQGNVALYITKKAPLRDNYQHIIGVIGTSINISGYFDLKDYIIHHTTGNVYWKDLKGRYLGCNNSFAELIGLNIPNEIFGKTDHELFVHQLGEERIKALVDIDQMVMQEGVEKTLEEVGIDKEGKLAVYMTKKVPMRNKQNNVIGLIGNSIDITKQKQAEMAKLEFLRNMGHDIMTPFSGILSISSVLYEEEEDPEKKMNLKYILQSSERLLQLFKQILEIADIGERKIIIEEISIKLLVNEVIEMLAASIKHKELILEVDCPDFTIHSDKIRIGRILLNLLGNAIKFTDKGLIKVIVERVPTFKIIVQDSGSGIPADKLEVIFEKFLKLTESGKHCNFTGSGIGLYIAKQFAMELGGDIYVESELGKGSKFTFILADTQQRAERVTVVEGEDNL